MLDTQNTQAGLAAAKKVAKSGYMRNVELTNYGRMVILYTMALDCQMRRAPPTAALERRALALKVPLVRFDEMTCGDIRKEMRKKTGRVMGSPKST